MSDENSKEKSVTTQVDFDKKLFTTKAQDNVDSGTTEIISASKKIDAAGPSKTPYEKDYRLLARKRDQSFQVIELDAPLGIRISNKDDHDEVTVTKKTKKSKLEEKDDVDKQTMCQVDDTYDSNSNTDFEDDGESSETSVSETSSSVKEGTNESTSDEDNDDVNE